MAINAVTNAAVAPVATLVTPVAGIPTPYLFIPLAGRARIATILLVAVHPRLRAVETGTWNRSAEKSATRLTSRDLVLKGPTAVLLPVPVSRIAPTVRSILLKNATTEIQQTATAVLPPVSLKNAEMELNSQMKNAMTEMSRTATAVLQRVKMKFAETQSSKPTKNAMTGMRLRKTAAPPA